MKEILNSAKREYISGLIPDDMPDWKKSWEEGYKIGENIIIKETPFLKKHGVKNDADYRLKMAEQGKLTWQINMGLANVEEEAAALREAEKFNKETGLCVSFAHQLPKNIVGTPKDKRENIPTALGFDLDVREDWEKITMASDVQAIFGDNHLGYPNAVFMTTNAVAAGSMYLGVFSTFQQIAPGCPDEVWNMNENVKALGIIAAKYDEKVIVDSNMDDGVPAYCMDLASYMAWGRLEKYIVTDLCKARYAFSFGNLSSNIVHKAAIFVAASDIFKTDDQPGVEFVYHNTVAHWNHHLHSNYGFQIPEALLFILLERKYKTGGSFMSVPITEKVSIPTVQEMLDMTGACQRAEECADDFEQIIDWTVVESLRDQVKEFSEIMFNNAMEGLKEAGVDITNPTEMLVVLKRMDPTKFEVFFHPSVVNDKKKEVVPMMPAALWSASEKQADRIVKKMKDTDSAKRLKGKRVGIVSGDLHYFGAYVLTKVLKDLGADVIYGGNSCDAIDVLDIADENDITDMCISLHNGQALHFSSLLLQLAKKRKKEYNFFVGGVLTSFVKDDDKEPTNVASMIQEMGIMTTNTVEELIEKLTMNESH